MLSTNIEAPRRAPLVQDMASTTGPVIAIRMNIFQISGRPEFKDTQSRKHGCGSWAKVEAVVLSTCGIKLTFILEDPFWKLGLRSSKKLRESAGTGSKLKRLCQISFNEGKPSQKNM